MAGLGELLLGCLESLLESGELRLCGLSSLRDLRELALGIGNSRLNVSQAAGCAPLLVKLPPQGHLRLLQACGLDPGRLQTTGV